MMHRAAVVRRWCETLAFVDAEIVSEAATDAVSRMELAVHRGIPQGPSGQRTQGLRTVRAFPQRCDRASCVVAAC